MTYRLLHTRITRHLTCLVLATALIACGGSEGEGKDSNQTATSGAQAQAAGQDPAQVAAAGEAAQKAAQAAADENVPGAIIATLNGETRTWYVDNNLTEWEELESGGTNVDIIGQVDPGDFSWTEAMNVRFELHGDGDDLRVANPSVIYYSEGATRHHKSRNASIVVSQAESSGDNLEVSGVFDGTVHFSAYSGDDAPKGGNPAEIQIEEGAFYARIGD